MKAKKTRWLLFSGVAGLVLIPLMTLVVLRTQSVWWAAGEPGLRPLLASIAPPGTLAGAAQGSVFPWDTPDIVLRWVDPWSRSDPSQPLVVPSSESEATMFAVELWGLQTKATYPHRDAASTWNTWVQDLDRRTPGIIPVAVAGKSDAELLTLLIWFVEGLHGPEFLEDTYRALSADPSGALDTAGSLPSDFAWIKAVEEIRLWMKAGRMTANWWDYTDEEVVQALRDNRARWALTWSGLHFPRTNQGIQEQSFQAVPALPGRRNFSLLGRWLAADRSPGWASSELVAGQIKQLSSVATSQTWLSSRGLILLDPDLPSVNQESRTLGLALRSAGTWVRAPAPNSDLARWQGLLEAIRNRLKS